MKNLKILIVFSIMSLSVNSIIAQKVEMSKSLTGEEPNFNKTEFGLMIMPSFASFDMKTYSGETVKGEATHGYGYGIMIERNLSNHFGIQSDVIYNSFSKKYMDKYLTRQVNIKYINIPLLFSISTNKSIPVNFNVVLGPQVGFNAGSNTKTSISSEKDTLQGVLSMKQIDFGIAYGAGLDFAFSKMQCMHAGIGFRGAYGLININNATNNTEASSYNVLSNTNIKTYSLYVNLTFSF